MYKNKYTPQHEFIVLFINNVEHLLFNNFIKDN